MHTISYDYVFGYSRVQISEVWIIEGLLYPVERGGGVGYSLFQGTIFR